MARNRRFIARFFSALLLVSGAVVLVVFPNAAAQTAADDYAENDPRFNTAQPCEALGGEIIVAGGGEEVCRGIDAHGTFCIVGSRDAFPCRGFYKRVVLCNSEHSRVALNPFLCGKRCDERISEARGAACVYNKCPASSWTTTMTQRELDNALLAAAENDDAASACELIRMGASADARNNIGETPLYVAAENNALGVAELLVNSGADVNDRDYLNWTPLHGAARYGALDVAKLLMANGASVNAKKDDGETPLHMAAENDAALLAKLLIDNGASVNARDNSGNMPLHVAVERGGAELAELLIANGASVNAKKGGGETPLHTAVKRGSLELAELLITNSASVNARDDGGNAPLNVAVERGYLRLAELLITNGASVNARVRDSNGETILHGAARDNALSLAALLVRGGANVNTQDYSGETPLHEVARHAGDEGLELAALLITNNASVNARDGGGNTPLHAAVEGGHLMLAALLIANGASVDVRVRDSSGETMLHGAARDNALSLAALLIGGGANVNAQDYSGETPLHEVARHAGDDGLELAALLIANGASVNVKNDDGEHSLHVAVDRGALDLANLLVYHGARFHVRSDASGEIILHGAARNNALSLAMLLIEDDEKGEYVNARDHSGETPLYEVASHVGDEGLELAELLIAKGANVNVGDRDGWTPLDRAFSRGHTGILNLLRRHGGECNIVCFSFAGMSSIVREGDSVTVSVFAVIPPGPGGRQATFAYDSGSEFIATYDTDYDIDGVAHCGSGKCVLNFSEGQSVAFFEVYTVGDDEIENNEKAEFRLPDGSSFLLTILEPEIILTGICDEATGMFNQNEVDVVLLQDLSASFTDDLAKVQGPGGIAEALANDLERRAALVRFGYASFTGYDDYVYRRHAPLGGKDAFLTAINSNGIGEGTDEPQLEALQMLANDNGMGFGKNSTKIVIVATDEPYPVRPGVPTAADIRPDVKSRGLYVLFAIGEDVSSPFRIYAQLAHFLNDSEAVPLAALVHVLSNSDDFLQSVIRGIGCEAASSP